MICKPEDAKNFTCCTCDRPCAGDKCMAWCVVEVFDHNSPANQPQQGGFPQIPVVQKLIQTGHGYCGLLYKG